MTIATLFHLVIVTVSQFSTKLIALKFIGKRDFFPLSMPFPNGSNKKQRRERKPTTDKRSRIRTRDLSRCSRAPTCCATSVGVTYDSLFFFHKHAEHTNSKVRERNRLLKPLSGSTWRKDKKTLSTCGNFTKIFKKN